MQVKFQKDNVAQNKAEKATVTFLRQIRKKNKKTKSKKSLNYFLLEKLRSEVNLKAEMNTEQNYYKLYFSMS